MTKKLHSVDRVVRFGSLVAVVALFALDIITGPLAYTLLAVTGILAATSVVSFYPIYRLFGISTCSVKTNGPKK